MLYEMLSSLIFAMSIEEVFLCYIDHGDYSQDFVLYRNFCIISCDEEFSFRYNGEVKIYRDAKSPWNIILEFFWYVL